MCFFYQNAYLKEEELLSPNFCTASKPIKFLIWMIYARSMASLESKQSMHLFKLKDSLLSSRNYQEDDRGI